MLTRALLLIASLDERRSRRNQRSLGPFLLEKALGQGGRGAVYRARHAMTGQISALKVLHPIDGEDLRFRFPREAQGLARLRHPNLVRVFETGTAGDRAYVSMEMLEGKPLSSHLREAGPLAPGIVVELLLAACDALAHLHAQGLVHGDVRSANLFLIEPDDLAASVAQGWRPRIKLLGFGLAQPPLDVRSDLHSLGVVAHEALTGRPPFQVDAEASLRVRVQTGEPEAPSALERIVSSLLSASRSDRPASAEEISVRLRALRSGRPPSSTSSPPADTPVAWQNLLRAARILLAKGRGTEGQVLLMECLAELGETLHHLSEEDREEYCQTHEEIAAALELHHRLSQDRGIQP